MAAKTLPIQVELENVTGGAWGFETLQSLGNQFYDYWTTPSAAQIYVSPLMDQQMRLDDMTAPLVVPTQDTISAGDDIYE
jgi:hypothetical protein